MDRFHPLARRLHRALGDELAAGRLLSLCRPAVGALRRLRAPARRAVAPVGPVRVHAQECYRGTSKRHLGELLGLSRGGRGGGL